MSFVRRVIRHSSRSKALVATEDSAIHSQREILHMIMALQYPIGIVLVLIGGVVWWLRWNRKWRNRVERVLLDQDEDLFDKGASYGGLVAWARYMAIPTGIVFVFPSQFALDVLIGTVTTGAFWWARLQRAKFLAFVRENKSAEVD